MDQDGGRARPTWLVVGGLYVVVIGAAAMVQDSREHRRPRAAPKAEPAPVGEPGRPEPALPAEGAFAGPLVGRLVEDPAVAAAAKARAELSLRLDEVRSALRTPDALSTEALAKHRATLDELLKRVNEMGAPSASEMTELRTSIDRLVVAKNAAEAKAFASLAGTTARQGLAKYAAAEDLVRKALEGANRFGNKADSAALTAIYKALLKDSDEYTAKVVTPEFIEATPWTDLLDAEHAVRWRWAKNILGFIDIENGVLTMTLRDRDTGQQGIAGILDQPTDDVRHFVLDMEFEVEGVVTMFFHVSPPPNRPNNLQSEAIDINATDRGCFIAGRSYHLVGRYIGTDLAIAYPNDMCDDWGRPATSWAKRRRGGIAFVVEEGARLTVTRMRIKLLR